MQVTSNLESKSNSHGSKYARSHRSQSLATGLKMNKTTLDCDNNGKSSALMTHHHRDASIFDGGIHKPPRIDKFGYNKETHVGRELLNRNTQNILAENQQIPQWWTSKRIRDTNFGLQSQTMNVTAPKQASTTKSASCGEERMLSNARNTKFTRTEMLQNRKKEAIPHISYDLDGDGEVSGRDYCLARKFDNGLKNFLTNDEKKQALNAIADGFEDKFIWNVEAGGAMRPYRLQQVRGAIVDAEDYLDVVKTYPKHPISDVVPHAKTMAELKTQRHDIEKQDIKKKKDDRDSRVAHLLKVDYKDYHVPQEFVQHPKYTATWQKNRDIRYEQRVKGGLVYDNVGINQSKLPDPTLAFVENTNLDVAGRRKTEMLTELKKMEKNFATHVEGQARIENREACILRLTFKGLDTVSKNMRFIKEKRTQELIDDMTKKFGDQVLGVHGAELPRFADNEKDQYYWRMQKGYNGSPEIQSQNRLQQTQKIWANNDKVKLSDATQDPAPIDPFKTCYVVQSSKLNIPEKINLVNHWQNSNVVGDPDLRKGWKPNLKWSEAEKDFKCAGVDRPHRTFEKIVKHAQEDDEREAIRVREMEDLIIKQAPRQLQMEVSQQIQQEKNMQASMMIGAQSARIGIKSGGKADVRFGSDKGSTMEANKKMDQRKNSLPEGASPLVKIDIIKKPEAGATIDQMMKTQGDNAMTSMFMQTGKLSLMNRMASPTGGAKAGETVSKKLNGTANSTMQMGSTMAATQMLGQTQNIGNGGNYSSPFRQTIARGMVTGVGFLNQTSKD